MANQVATAVFSTPVISAAGLALHGQGDNLSSVALVANDPALPTGAAVRWTFRYDLAYPPFGATLYRRRARDYSIHEIDFTNLGTYESSMIATEFINVTTHGPTMLRVVQGQGLFVPRVALIRFGRPVIIVAVLGSGNPKQQIEVTALHHPNQVDAATGPQPTAGGIGGLVRADLIDAVSILVGSPMWVTKLRVVLLISAMSTDWDRIASVDPAAGGNSLTCSPPDTSQPFADDRNKAGLNRNQRLADVLQTLYNGSVTDAYGVPIPMAQRLLSTGTGGPGDPNVRIPTLAFLLMCAINPGVARDLGLLIDIAAAWAAQADVWDYLIVGHWCPRPALSASGTSTDLAGPYFQAPMVEVKGLLFESLSQLNFVTAAAGQPGGLQLGPDLIWVHFPQNVQAVELELEGDGAVEFTAFSQGRIVDWTVGVERSRILVCGDAIDTVTIQGYGAVMVRSVVHSTKDAALSCGTSACVGDVGFWMFQARGHAGPAPPTTVTTGQANDPSGDPEKIRAGVLWDAAPSVDVSFFGPVAYQIFRGPDSQHLDTAIAGQNQPFVVPSRPPGPTGPSFHGQQLPWYYTDPVDDGSTWTYGVASADIFGRLSGKTSSNPMTFADRTPPTAPVQVSGSVQQDGTLLVTWMWPPSPAPGAQLPTPDTDLKGFHVYYKAGTVGPTPVDGAVTQVDATPPDYFTVMTDINPTALGSPAAMTMEIVRAGGDHYQVKQASAVPVGASQDLQLDLFRNLSTPTAIAVVGNPIRIFGKPWQPGRTATAQDYDSFEDVADPNARQHTLATPWPPPDERGRQILSVGVSAYDEDTESNITGPVRSVHVQTSVAVPPTPSSTDESDVWANPPDVTGRSIYTFVAAATAGVAYHVYRALDETLLVVDTGQRDPVTGQRGGAPANPGPLTQADFDSVTLAAPPQLDRMPNRLLHALANLLGNEPAFEQLTADPVVATTNSISYLDRTLPGSGRNRYVYRLRSVAPSGELGDFGWAYAPVRLWPAQPTRPTIAQALSRGRFVDLNWIPSPERDVDRYRIYVTTDELRATDERSMTLVAEVTADDAGDPSRVPNMGVTVQGAQGRPYFFRLVAVASHPAPVGMIASAPSDAVAIAPQTFVAPAAPDLSQMTAERVAGAGGDEVHINFPGDDNPTTRYMLLRAAAGAAAPVLPVTTWQSIPGNTPVILLPPDGSLPVPPAPINVVLVDTSPLTTDAEYLVGCTNETSQVAYSNRLRVNYP